MASSRAFAATLMVITGALAGCGSSDGELRERGDVDRRRAQDGRGSRSPLRRRRRSLHARRAPAPARGRPGRPPARDTGLEHEVARAHPRLPRGRRIASRRALRLPRSVGGARSRPARSRIARKHLERSRTTARIETSRRSTARSRRPGSAAGSIPGESPSEGSPTARPMRSRSGSRTAASSAR